jgi:hypothetical protein
MSKVALSGNASGTGTFTIASPNSNTDRTLSLPDNTGTILTTATAGVPVNGPAFRANTVTAQTIANSTFTKVAYNVEEFDTNNCYDPTTNYRFTPTVAGYYQINANASLGGGTIGAVQCYIYKNGFSYTAGSGIPNNNNVGGKISASALIYLNGSSDYVEFYVWQNNGTSTNLQTGAGDNVFSGFLARSAT